EDAAGGAADELRFSVRRRLEVQAANGPTADGKRTVALRQRGIQPVLLKFAPAPHAGKVAASVAMRFGLDNVRPGKLRLSESHGVIYLTRRRRAPLWLTLAGCGNSVLARWQVTG